MEWFFYFIFTAKVTPFYVVLYIFSSLQNRAHRPCHSPALLLTFWRALSQSWPRRTWTTQTSQGENSSLKVMSSTKAKVVTYSRMMVSVLIFEIISGISLPRTHTSSSIFVFGSYQEPQGKHPQPQNRPWAETYLWHDGGTNGQRTPRQGRSAIWRYCCGDYKYTQCVLVYAFCIRRVIVLVCFLGLISRAMPREGPHGEPKERPLITGSIMQGRSL